MTVLPPISAPRDALKSRDEQQANPPPLFRAARAGGVIGVSTVGALLVGFFLQLVIAYRFGAGSDTDAFFMAQGTSELLAKILLGGSLTSVFLPVFVEHLSQGREDRAWRLANHLFHLAAVVFVVLLALLEVFTDQLTSLIAPGFPPDTHRVTVLLLRVMLPAFFFGMLTDLATAILHSFRAFGMPALSRLIMPVTSLLFVLLFGHRAGIVALALGTLVGATVQLALILRALVRTGYRYQPIFSLRDQDVLRVFRLVAPFVFSILAAQASGIIYRILVSHFPEGSLSALKFGDKISSMANALFLASITTVAFPALSQSVAERAEGEVRATLAQALRLLLFFGVPLTLGIMFLRLPLARLLYERGSFTAEDTVATAAVLAILVWGLVANGMSSLFGHFALALKATRISVGATILTQTVTSGLFLALAPRLGIRGLALGSAISPFILTGLYLFLLRGRVRGIWRLLVTSALPKFAVSGTALVVGLLLGQRLIAGAPAGALHDILTLTVGTFCGAAAYLGTAWLLKIEETRVLRAILRYAVLRVRP